MPSRNGKNEQHKTYLKCLIGSSQLPSLMHVDKSAKVWIICSCGKPGPKANASLIISDSRAPPANEKKNHFYFIVRTLCCVKNNFTYIQ